eukprot:s3967_g1.t1
MQRACEMVQSLLKTTAAHQRTPYHPFCIQILHLMQKEQWHEWLQKVFHICEMCTADMASAGIAMCRLRGARGKLHICEMCAFAGLRGSKVLWRSSDVEEVTPPDPRRGRKETREPVERNLLKEARKRRLSRERRERHEARREHRDRSRSESSRRRGRSPDSRKETPPAERDDRKPAHPKHAPKKDRGGSGGSKERCPICWQKVSIHQSGKDQHMWTNATCIAWQIYNNQQTSKKNWSLAQKQAKELKAYRAKKAEKDLGGPLLVSKETKEAAEKAQASTAAWARGKKPCRVDSSSPSPERVKKTKAKRRPPSPSPSPLPAKKSKQRRSSSDSSSRPRRRRERQIIINVK